ncbi:MAG: DUF5684 domain-containing protein [Acidobacteriota bacterium]
MTDDQQALALVTGVWGGICCFWLVFYLYFSLCLYKIAQKTGVQNAWMAWIPILQIVPLLEAGGKPIWWILLLLVPLLNLVIGIILWMAVAERRGKPAWVGILILVPFVGIFVPAYLAFSE